MSALDWAYKEKERKKKSRNAGLRPHALREGSLTSRLAGASPKGPQTYIDTPGLGESQKQSKWGSGGLSAMLMDVRTLLLPFSTAALPANSTQEYP
eukprot:1155621-Pelagomonas_calceolata.AAC.3